SCSESLMTGSGESIGGPGDASVAANLGGSGGVGELAGVDFNSNAPVSSTPGHAQSGLDGTNYNGRDAGAPGQAYGAADGGTLTLGSGSGGNISCSDAVPAGPVRIDLDSRAGGIVFVRARVLTMGASGSIKAGGINQDCRTAN